MAVRIPIVTDFDGKGLQRAFAAFKELETTGEKAAFALKQSLVPATLALGALATGLVMAGKAAAEDQRAQAELERQIAASTDATTAQVAASADFIDSMQMQFAVADTELRPALASLVRGSEDLATAQRDLGLALDIAAGTGKGVGEVADALAKAYGGNYKALKQLSPEVAQLIKDEASLNEITAALAQTFDGAATVAANSAEGQMKRLSIAMGEAQEAIGAAFLPVLEAIVPVLTNLAQIMQDNAGLVVAFAAALGTLAGAIIAANAAMVAWRAINIATQAINYALAASFTAVQIATGIGIATVLAGIAAFALYKNRMKAMQDQTVSFTEATGKSVQQLQREGDQIGKTIKQQEDLTGAKTDTKNAAAEMAAKIEEARKALQDRMAKALDDATKKLQAAKEKYQDFANTVSQSITGELSIKTAADAAEESGKSIIAELAKQAEAAKKFGDKVRTLLALGLSEQALGQVLDAGVEAGTKIADELLKGGQNAITGPGGINELVGSLQDLADAVGIAAADKFYAAGVAQGEALVAGVQSVIDRYTGLMNMPGMNLAGIKALEAGFDTAVTGVTNPTAPVFDVAQFQRERLGDQYNIAVYGGINTSAEQGRAVIDAIKAANRADGPADILVR